LLIFHHFKVPFNFSLSKIGLTRKREKMSKLIKYLLKFAAKETEVVSKFRFVCLCEFPNPKIIKEEKVNF